MHGEGRFSLIRLFTSFAMIGAEWVMWVLVFLSILSVAFMLERGRYYWSLSDNLEDLAKDLRNLLRKNDIDGARQRLGRSPSPAAMIALAGLNEAGEGPDSAEEAMAGATARTRLGLERNLAFLGTVGNNAPFIGLLGTVIGIIQAFDALRTNQTNAATAHAGETAAMLATAQQTLGNTGRVMGTIAEALVATAIGLFVAIPAVAAFNYFQRKVRSIVASGDTLSHVVLAHLRAVHLPDAGPYRTRDAAAPARASAKGAEARAEEKKPGTRSEAKSEGKPGKDSDVGDKSEPRSKGEQD
jgi:biopolymer transport protein ExbB